MSRQLTIEQALSNAKKAAKQGNVNLAVQLFTAILQQQPSHPVAKKGLRKLQKFSPQGQSSQALAANPSQDQIDALISFYHSGQMEQAEQSCRQLLETYPRSLTLLNVFGSTLQVQGKLQEAVQAFDEAIRLKPDFADAHNNRGNALKQLGHLEEAVASYDAAVQLKPDFADAYYNRGNTRRDHGQLADAVASYEKAIEAEPAHVKAHRNLSVLKKYDAGDAQIDLMKRIYADSGSSEANRLELGFALAKAFEDLQEYDTSFDYLQEGNRLRKKELGYDIALDKRLFATIEKVFSQASLGVDVAAGKVESIRPLFIVGMMRSGTSVVEQILASHSGVHGAGELDTMNQLLAPFLFEERELSTAAIRTVRAAYLKELAALKVPEKTITDKMPLNFRWIGCILSAFPDAKIVHVEREPRATCWSIYKYYFPAEGNAYAYDMEDLAEYYNLYRKLMSFWHEQYPGRIYDLSYEALTENQEQETRKLLEFCELLWEAQCLDFHKTERAVKTTSSAQIRSKMYQGSSEAWKKYEDHLQPLIKALGHPG